jgi:hypothetical protein
LSVTTTVTEPSAQPAQHRPAAGQLTAGHREQHRHQDRQLFRDGGKGQGQPVQQHLVPALPG